MCGDKDFLMWKCLIRKVRDRAPVINSRENSSWKVVFFLSEGRRSCRPPPLPINFSWFLHLRLKNIFLHFHLEWFPNNWHWHLVARKTENAMKSLWFLYVFLFILFLKKIHDFNFNIIKNSFTFSLLEPFVNNYLRLFRSTYSFIFRISYAHWYYYLI